LNNAARESGETLMHEVLLRCSRLNVPAQAVLELTYRCNLHCAHCYVDIAEADEMSTEEWRWIIDELKAAGTIFLLFTGGEITLRADLLEIAAYARHIGFFVGFLTNGTLITPDLARCIAALRPFSVATSLYGTSAATHESVTGREGSFGKTLNGIRLLVESGLTPTVQVLAMKSNLSELGRTSDLVESLGARVKIDLGLAPTKSGGTFPLRLEPGLEDLMRCGWRPGAPDEGQEVCQGTCKAGRAICSVSPGGNVFPCIMFPLKLGNLRHSSFKKIWGLEPRAELRYLRSIKRTDLGACGKCDLAAYCQRCTGIAYIESGRMIGPSPSACRQAQVRWRLSQATEVTPCQKNPT
jgi:radical SAM protein with 4Fe4S-binding SPASM domain